jgi:hypothetical protein
MTSCAAVCDVLAQKLVGVAKIILTAEVTEFFAEVAERTSVSLRISSATCALKEFS